MWTCGCSQSSLSSRTRKRRERGRIRGADEQRLILTGGWEEEKETDQKATKNDRDQDSA